MEEKEIPSGTEETSTGEADVKTTETTEVVIDDSNVDTVDNVTQLRNWGKSLKTDLDTFKPAHEFITKSFGSMEVAEQAKSLFEGFTGTEFDADAFIKHINSLSPNRANQLVEKLASEKATALADAKMKELFGGEISKEELNMFNDWKKSGYGLGGQDDIPEALKFNADGTPKSDEEIQFLRDMKKRVDEVTKSRESDLSRAEQEKELQRQSEIQSQIMDFSQNRIKILDNEFKTFNLLPDASDTAEVSAEKNAIRTFIINGVTGALVEDLEGKSDYTSAIQHIQDGEPALARRYEARIETKLLDIMRSKPVLKLLQAFATKDTEIPEPRPDLSNTGGSKTPEAPKGRMTADDIFSKLVSEGKLGV